MAIAIVSTDVLQLTVTRTCLDMFNDYYSVTIRFKVSLMSKKFKHFAYFNRIYSYKVKQTYQGPISLKLSLVFTKLHSIILCLMISTYLCP